MAEAVLRRSREALAGDPRALQDLDGIRALVQNVPETLLEVIGRAAQAEPHVATLAASMLLREARDGAFPPSNLWETALSYATNGTLPQPCANQLLAAVSAGAMRADAGTVHGVFQKASACLASDQSLAAVLLLRFLVDEYARHSPSAPIQSWMEDSCTECLALPVAVLSHCIGPYELTPDLVDLTTHAVSCLARWSGVLRIPFASLCSSPDATQHLLQLVCASLTRIPSAALQEAVCDLLEGCTVGGRERGVPWGSLAPPLAAAVAPVLAAGMEQLEQRDEGGPEGDLEAAVQALCRSAACLALADKTWVRQGDDTAVALLRSLIGGSGLWSLRSSSVCLEVWPKLEHPATTTHQSSEVVGGPLHAVLLPVLLRQAARWGRRTAEGEEEEEEEEWHLYREQTLSEALSTCYHILRSSYLSFLLDHLRAPGADWAEVEAVLYAARVVALEASRQALLAKGTESGRRNFARSLGVSVEEVARDAEQSDELLALLVAEAVGGSGSAKADEGEEEQRRHWRKHPLVLGTTMRLVALLARWLTQSPRGLTLLEEAARHTMHSLQCLPQLGAGAGSSAEFRGLEARQVAPGGQREVGEPSGKGGNLAAHTAEALRNLCSRAAHLFASPDSLGALISAVGAAASGGHLEGEPRATVTQGLCRVISQLPPEAAEQALAALASPLLERLAAAAAQPGPCFGDAEASALLVGDLQALGVMVRTTRANVEAHAGSKAELLLQEASPVIGLASALWRDLEVVVRFLGTHGAASAPAQSAVVLEKTCEVLRHIAVLPVHGGGSATLEQAALIAIHAAAAAPCEALAFVSEMADVWGPQAERQLYPLPGSPPPAAPAATAAPATSSPPLPGSSGSAAAPKPYHFVLAQLVEAVVLPVATACEAAGDGAAVEVTQALLDAASSLAGQCPAVLLSHSSFPVVTQVAMRTARSLEVAPALAALRYLSQLLSLEEQVLGTARSSPGSPEAQRALHRWQAFGPAVEAQLAQHGNDLVGILLAGCVGEAPEFLLEHYSKAIHGLLWSNPDRVRSALQGHVPAVAEHLSSILEGTAMASQAADLARAVLGRMCQIPTVSLSELQSSIQALWSVSNRRTDPATLLREPNSPGSAF